MYIFINWISLYEFCTTKRDKKKLQNCVRIINKNWGEKMRGHHCKTANATEMSEIC